MNSAFLQAAASYFGMNPEQMGASELRSDQGVAYVTFEIPIFDDDWAGIIERMKAQREMSTETEGIGGRQVQHVDTDEQDASELPQSVWVDSSLLDERQKQMGSDYRSITGIGDQVLMQVVMLRPDQIPAPTQPWSWHRCVVEFGPDFDKMPADEQASWGSRYSYIRHRKELIEGEPALKGSPQNEQSAQPSSVWVPTHDTTMHQRAQAIEALPGSKGYLVSVSLLDDQQRAQYVGGGLKR